jgi:hypothetical protein
MALIGRTAAELRHDAWCVLAHHALRALGLPCDELEPGVYRVQLPEPPAGALDGRRTIDFTADPEVYDSSDRPELELFAPDRRFFHWLMEQAHAAGVLQDFAPPGEPQGVAAIAHRLFAAYWVDGGRVHLAGCLLEWRPIVAVETLPGAAPCSSNAGWATPPANVQPRVLYVGPDGEVVADGLATALRLAEAQPCPRPPGAEMALVWPLVYRAIDHARPPEATPLASGEAASYHPPQPASAAPPEAAPPIEEHAAHRAAPLADRSSSPPDNEIATPEDAPRSATTHDSDTAAAARWLRTLRIIWTRYCSGKLRFRIGAQTVDLPFQGWASTLQAPPFVCPHTGRKTFHITATDDGRVVAAESVATCEVSGTRVLAHELLTCSVTGKRVRPELTETCPVLETPVLAEHMAICGMCQQRVSPAALADGRCAACRQMKPVTASDPRMSLILHEYPQLDRWRRWRLAETARAFIALGSGWFKQLLLVLDKEELEPLYVATCNRLQRRWVAVPVEQFAQWLA